MSAAVEAGVQHIPSLFGDLNTVPQDHVRDVAEIKRFLERWTMDPSFRQAYEANPAATIAGLGLSLRIEEITPFIDDDEARALTEAIKAGTDGHYPLSVRRYRAFYREKRQHRRVIRRNAQSSNPHIAAWRSRQIQRCIGQLGMNKADALVHAPAAFELARGCSVGCWFCGVSAPRLELTFHYDDATSRLWRGSLQVMRDVMGDCIKHGFLYWATDPLDNPDYEHFLADFHEVTGRCPQTTTAMGARDIERTRRLLRLASSMDSEIDRFSIITLRMLHQLHEGFAPEELVRVECVPQNRESADRYRKANAGRARQYATRRAKEMMPEETSSTIACVSGFLFNMVDRQVCLVTPCNGSDRWPLGFWTYDEGHFDSPEELRELIEGMVERHMPIHLGCDDVVRCRPDINVEIAGGTDLVFRTKWIRTTFRNVPALEQLVPMMQEGTWTAGEMALTRENESGVPMEQTFLLLTDIFNRGMLDEEPRPASAIVEREAAAV